MDLSISSSYQLLSSLYDCTEKKIHDGEHDSPGWRLALRTQEIVGCSGIVLLSLLETIMNVFIDCVVSAIDGNCCFDRTKASFWAGSLAGIVIYDKIYPATYGTLDAIREAYIG